MTYTVGSLFSGIGGLDLAAHWAGFTTSWFVEREPFCQKVLAKHWPDVPCHSDVFECHNLPHVDVVVGGFPCQPFSVAGNRKGADDERYLLPEMLRIISEVKPYAVLFENVPGFPSLSDGAEFKYLLRALAEMGFNAEWGHLRASDSGAPHQRERWFCVAYTTIQSGNGINNHAGKFMVREAISQLGNNSGAEFVAYAAGIRRQRHQQGSRQDRFQQGRASKLARGNQTQLANSIRYGNGNTGTGRALHHGKRHSSQKKRRWIIQQHGFIPPSESMGYPDGERRKEPVTTWKQSHQSKAGTGQNFRPGRPNSAGWQRGQTQPLIRGTSNGLPRWMDFVGWPARPGEDQHTYEPSRVTSAKTPDRAARLKALGNAVVPQVAYPLFAAIHEWLTSLDAEQVA